jgi:hypothetical protein
MDWIPASAGMTMERMGMDLIFYVWIGIPACAGIVKVN